MASAVHSEENLAHLNFLRSLAVEAAGKPELAALSRLFRSNFIDASRAYNVNMSDQILREGCLGCGQVWKPSETCTVRSASEKNQKNRKKRQYRKRPLIEHQNGKQIIYFEDYRNVTAKSNSASGTNFAGKNRKSNSTALPGRKADDNAMLIDPFSPVDPFSPADPFSAAGSAATPLPQPNEDISKPRHSYYCCKICQKTTIF